MNLEGNSLRMIMTKWNESLILTKSGNTMALGESIKIQTTKTNCPGIMAKAQKMTEIEPVMKLKRNEELSNAIANE
jgi:hypothetical protein